ncbi:MAG: ATP synthase F1 subunit gamma [Puniceicoccales bacterium]|jgi:F-type H+-transporting ATPase subunit gamma|nr:ATP synthase F1 subunit gamma [Puniceicoccales bacterium]
MKSFKEIKQRMRAVQNTAKITRAMQLVASSKMHRAQQLAVGGRSYSMRLAEITDRLLTEFTRNRKKKFSHPLLEEREIYCRGIILVSTNKGLCGSLNQNLFRTLPPANDSVKYIAAGKKGKQFLASRQLALLAEFPFTDGIPFHEVRSLADFARDAYLRGEIDSIEVASTVYVNTICQRPILQTLLPLKFLCDGIVEQRKLLRRESNAMPEDPRDIVIEPTPDALMQALVESVFRETLYHLLLEAKAAEQSARMVAMKTATDNAEAIGRTLNLEYNKARQAAITNEIIEISSAAVIAQ